MDLPTPPNYIAQYPVRPKTSKVAWFILFFLIGDMVILLIILNWLVSHPQQTLTYQLPSLSPVPSATADFAKLNPPIPTVTPVPTNPPTPRPTATIQPTVTPQPTPTVGPIQLLINPDFEQSWNVGWKQATGEDLGGRNYIKILQYPAINTNALGLDHTGQTFTSIYQLVKVKNLRLKFSGQVAAYTSTNGFWADTSGLAGLGLNFYYNDGNPAQPAASLLYATGSKFEAGRAFGLYPLNVAAKRGAVVARAFDIRGQTINIANLQSEVQRYLPGLEIDRVSAVALIVFAGGSEKCKETECISRLYAGSFNLQTLIP